MFNFIPDPFRIRNYDCGADPAKDSGSDRMSDQELTHCPKLWFFIMLALFSFFMMTERKSNMPTTTATRQLSCTTKR